MLRVQAAEDWVLQGRRLVRERQRREKRSRKVQQQLLEKNSRAVRALRQEEESREREISERKAEHAAKGRERVLEANALDARLDRQEAAVDDAERREHASARANTLAAAAAVRRMKLESNREAVAAAAAARVAITSARSAVEAAAVVKGEAKREEAKSLEHQAKADEEAYLTRAHANRDRARSWTLSARKSVRAVARVKARAASRERANDVLVTEEKLRIRASNRREVQAIYSARFASPEMEARWEASAIAKLQGITADAGRSLAALSDTGSEPSILGNTVSEPSVTPRGGESSHGMIRGEARGEAEAEGGGEGARRDPASSIASPPSSNSSPDAKGSPDSFVKGKSPRGTGGKSARRGGKRQSVRV